MHAGARIIDNLIVANVITNVITLYKIEYIAEREAILTGDATRVLLKNLDTL